MTKLTEAQQEIIRKSIAGEGLTNAENLAAFDMPFEERSLISMRNYARRQSVI